LPGSAPTPQPQPALDIESQAAPGANDSLEEIAPPSAVTSWTAARVFEETASMDFLPAVPAGGEVAPPRIGELPAAEATSGPTWALAGLLALEALGPPEVPRRWAQDHAAL
jgi:hypothetical protein